MAKPSPKPAISRQGNKRVFGLGALHGCEGTGFAGWQTAPAPAPGPLWPEHGAENQGAARQKILVMSLQKLTALLLPTG